MIRSDKKQTLSILYAILSDWHYRSLNMKDLISIIIPVYNADPYLYSCIQSVLEQTYQHFELILIDDGSKDTSKTICTKMCSLDKRIHLVSQCHQGVSVARNKGIKAAKGDYLFFLDSDDMIHPCLLEVLHTILTKTHASLAAAEYHFITNEDSQKIIGQKLKNQYFSDYIYLDNQTSIDLFAQGHTNMLYGTGGIMIRRTDVKHQLFDKTLTVGEDTKFIYQLLLSGADVIILNKTWYYYRRYKDNSSQKRMIESCSSMFRCESYMRDTELKNNRHENALKQEFILLDRMCEWYMVSRKNNNKKLCCYLKVLAKKELASKIFLQSGWQIKLKFVLTFYSLPLSRLWSMASRLYYSFINILVLAIRQSLL